MKEKKVMERFGKKVVASILALTLVVSGVCFPPSKSGKVLANDETTVAFITEQYNDIGNFKMGGAGNYTAPKPQTVGCEDWLFAGWFTTEDCETAYKESTGSAYAKFVPAEVLSVKCQVTSGTNASSTDKSKMRFITTVDSLQYSEIGFNIEYNGKTLHTPIKTVFKTIVATDNGIKYPYVPQIFNEQSNYFGTVILNNIPNNSFPKPFYIEPYWKTLDGTIVYGVERYARVEDSYLGIVNVPVRLYSDSKIASGTVSVSYDAENFEYADGYTTTLMDNTSVTTPFMENGKLVSSVRITEKAAGSITLGVSNDGKDVTADGMLANLRFKVKNPNTLQDKNTFRVNADLVNAASEKMNVVAPDVVYSIPVITNTHDNTDKRIYFANVGSGQPFVLETTMKDMSTTDWPSSGFILNAGENNWVKFVVRYAGDHYDMVVWRNLGTDNDYYCAKVYNFPTEELKANPFTDTDGTLKLALVYSGDKYFVYVNGNLMFDLDQTEEIQNGHSVASILGDGDVSLGLFAERQITFKDWTYGMEDSDFAKYPYTVSGMVTGGDAQAVVTIVNEENEIVFSGNADSEDRFTTALYNGTYYITAQSDTEVSKAVPVTVKNGKVKGDTTVQLNRDALHAEAGNMTYDLKTGGYFTVHGATDNQAYIGTVENGQPFVLETTMKDMSTTDWPSSGFILNAGGDSWVKIVVRYAEDHYDLVVWRNIWDSPLYCAKVWDFPTAELRANPFTGPDGTMKLALVYSGGMYAVYVNDTFIFDLDENAEIQNGHSVASILGSEDVRLGLFAERQITFTDWSYMPLLKSETGSFTYDPKTGSYSSIHDITDNQAYIGSVASGQPFVLETTMKGMSTEEWPSSGFILNAGENNWVKFVVRKTNTNYDLLVWRNLGTDNDYYCAKVYNFPTEELKANPFTGTNDTLKLSLVYSGSKYSVYVNGTLVFDLAQTEEIQFGHSVASILGGGDVRLGLFAERQITFTDWSYKPLLRAEVGNMTYDSETGYYATVYDDTDNQAYIGSVTGRQPFVLETTMKDMGTEDWPSSGIILNAGGDSWVKIVVRYAGDHYDMVVWRNIWDSPLFCARVFDFPTEELKANPFTGADGTLKLSLVYSGSNYSVYVNGTRMFNLDENEVINENSHTVASILGSGNVRLGLFAERQITFTDYSFSSTQSSDLTHGSLGGDEGEDF